MKKTERFSDASKRCADWYQLHRMADPLGNIGKWFAVALSDGSSDGTLYDSRRDCITHQKHNEFYYAYIQIVPSNMTIGEAEVFLTTQRRMYDVNVRIIDPDLPNGGPEMIPRMSNEDQQSQLRRLFGSREKPRNLLIPGRDF